MFDEYCCLKILVSTATECFHLSYLRYITLHIHKSGCHKRENLKRGNEIALFEKMTNMKHEMTSIG